MESEEGVEREMLELGYNDSELQTRAFIVNEDHLTEGALVARRADSHATSSGDDDDEMDEDGVELPSSLIATGLPTAVFDDIDTKSQFECQFRVYDSTAHFLYLKSFRRARVDFPAGGAEAAARARVELSEGIIAGKLFNTYFIQPIYSPPSEADRVMGGGHRLRPPPLEKQFLISPPASPPVGWEQVREAQPVVSFELMASMAALQPGIEHEVHSPTALHPGIVISTCIDEHDDGSGQDLVVEESGIRPYQEGTGANITHTPRPKIVQTRCPPATGPAITTTK